MTDKITLFSGGSNECHDEDAIARLNILFYLLNLVFQMEKYQKCPLIYQIRINSLRFVYCFNARGLYLQSSRCVLDSL